MFRSTGWLESPWVIFGCITVVIIIALLTNFSDKE